MPPVLCTHIAQLTAIHMHQHQDALLQTIQRLEAVVPQNCPHPHESQDKGATGFGPCYLVCVLYWYEPCDLLCSDSHPLHHWASRKAWTETQAPTLCGQVQTQVFENRSLLHLRTIFIWVVCLQPHLLLWLHTCSSWLVLASYSLACQSPIPVANTTALKQSGTVLLSCYREINPFHP